jgi:hypothetical protein
MAHPGPHLYHAFDWPPVLAEKWGRAEPFVPLKAPYPMPLASTLLPDGRRRWLALSLLSAAACSDPVQKEMFENTRDSLAENVGLPCMLAGGNEAQGTDVIVENNIDCGADQCIRVGEESYVEHEGEPALLCSCRCGGAVGSGAYCSCPSGYLCSRLEGQVAGLPTGYAGSYCVPWS